MAMKSKISFINPGILLNDFKGFSWIGVVYLLGLLFSTPLQILMLYSEQKKFGGEYVPQYDLLQNQFRDIFQFDSGMQIILILTIPVIVAILLFRYLQVNRSANMIHTLPIKRETLYNTHLIAGIILLYLPIIVTGLTSWIIKTALGIHYFTNQDIITWIGINLIFNLILFISTVTVGMMTGMTSVQGVLTYILLFLPTGLSFLLLHNIRVFVYGFAYDYYLENIIISPLMRIPELYHNPFTTIDILTYVGISITLYFIARILYNRRQLETATCSISFSTLRPIFKYGVTFCSMLLVGSYFNEVQDGLGWTIFGYFLGSLLGYVIIEIIINKSLSIFKVRNLKGYVIYAVITTVLITGINFDLTGYEKTIPELKNVESVYFNHSFYNLTNPDIPYASDTHELQTKLYTRNNIKMIYSDPYNIVNIYRLHKQIINNIEEEKNQIQSNYNSHNRNICLAYKLKNGRMLYRHYEIDTNKYMAYLKPLYESLEYKKLHYDILNITPEPVDKIEVNAHEINKSVKITDPTLIKQAINALQNDVKDQTYESMTDNKPAWADINILMNNEERIHLNWNKSFINFEQWLKEINEFDNARIIPAQDIKYAIVERNLDNNEITYEKKQIAYQETEAPKDSNIKRLEIKDPEQLEVCLRRYKYKGNTPYTIGFYLNNGDTFYGGFFEEDMPEFVKEFFAE